MEGWEKVLIRDNNEPLTEIRETENIKLLTEHKYLSPQARKTVVDMLNSASVSLPDGHKFLIITAYRPLSMQKKLWRQRLFQMARKNPLKFIFHLRQVRREASQYTAPPGGSAHQCGAALDVTIIDKEGNRLDMGTDLTSYGEKCHTFYEDITEYQKKNRRILYDAMTKAGFINYPREWWHYSYGDRFWAAANNLSECIYGPTKL
jgi:D-alanyl-D-alanine dipeptidase